MHQFLVSAGLWGVLQLLFFTIASATNPNQLTDRISVNCGSAGTSVALNGRPWQGDMHSNFTIKGSSTRSAVTGDLTVADDPVPYKTARISRSQFSYIFRLNSGQKLIRLHFNPGSYNGFTKSKDFFNVEAGPFTLLTNFSASITAVALSVKFFTKEYCIAVDENYSLKITFSPAIAWDKAQDTHAFINGIELISVPDTFVYCHIGHSGVQVVGNKFMVCIDNTTALERIHQQNVKWNSVSSGDGVFGTWAAVLSDKENKVNNITWKVLVEVGFRYLVRLHFCGHGLKTAESGNNNFSLFINHMLAYTSIDVQGDREDDHGLLYRDYTVMEKGRKSEGKRSILISLQSRNKFIYKNGPLEGFEIFKLSNNENSLASPTPVPPTRDSSFWMFQVLLLVLDRRDAVATVIMIVVCLINIIVHILRLTWEVNFPVEEKKPTTRVMRICRCFSLAQVQSATDNFSGALIIGKGGFGKVYKGFIDCSQEILAIKRLKPDSKQGKREFWTEVETLSEVRHVNLVSLIGYCNEKQEMILVYDYMPNGTLADHLYKLKRKSRNYTALSWDERLKICIGAGRGLDYLHTGKGIIHRDVKTSNILLDENFVAKVSDFGLAKTECVIGLKNHDSTNVKGTFGYIDPDYFKTRKLTKKSDTYAFGVVLLEVLCGRPAVDPNAGEDERSLSMWALDNINRGKFDQIVAPDLSGEVSPESLKAFVEIVKGCLHDDPNKRPTIAHIVINLEFALDVANFPHICTFPDKRQLANATSLLPDEITGVADVFPRTADRTSKSTMQPTNPSSHLQNWTSLGQEQTNSRLVNAQDSNGKRGRKFIMHKLSRLFPWDSVRLRPKPSKMTYFDGISMSEPMTNKVNSKIAVKASSQFQQKEMSTEGRTADVSSPPNLRIFSFSELKAATSNFSDDTILGEGGFGRVHRGFLKIKNNGNESLVAIKRLSQESTQGFEEWMSEVNILGKICHSNLVTLLGYSSEDKELLLVYEFMQKGSLDNYLFRRDPAVQTLSWNIRLKILIGAARGLVYLHGLTSKVVYRDFKSSNILLDGSYNAKLSDFGLAKFGPLENYSHVTTRVMGTYGYAAPEYIATGHLYVKSDVYGFGVVLLETLTGLRAHDLERPPGQQNLVDWMPFLSSKRKLIEFTDSCLKGAYPPKSALQLYQLAKTCLEPEPKRRPSMSEVVDILEAIERTKEHRVRFHYQGTLIGLAALSKEQLVNMLRSASMGQMTSPVARAGADNLFAEALRWLNIHDNFNPRGGPVLLLSIFCCTRVRKKVRIAV